MPAQKRSSEHLDDESNNDDENNYQNPEVEGEEREEEDEEFEEAEEENVVENEEEEEEEEADGDVLAEAEQVEEEQGEQDSDEESGASNDEEKPEFISVKLQDIRKEVQCPICLGIIRKTRTVMECLHRFCRECIDKSMRMGNNECPACRTHCASRRSLRDDPRYDAIIAALYPDIDKYEEEELAFRDEEKTRNKQIQASIAQTFRRQTEALGRRRTTAKAVAAFMRRSQGHYRRGRSSRNSRATELQSDIEEDGHGNEGGRDSSSADERSVEVKPKRCRRWGGPRFSQPSSGATNADDNDDLEVSKESAGASSVFTGNPEVLAWGGGGVRSNTRYGSVSNGKNGRAGRISKLVDYLRNSEENDDKMVVHLTLVPFDEKIAPTLEEPYLCCDPTFSIERICEYVAPQTKLKTEEVEILLVAEPSHVPCRSLPSSEDDPSEVDQDSLQIPDDPIPRVDPLKDNLQILEIHETLSQLLTRQPLSGGHLVLAYRQRTSS